MAFRNIYQLLFNKLFYIRLFCFYDENLGLKKNYEILSVLTVIKLYKYHLTFLFLNQNEVFQRYRESNFSFLTITKWNLSLYFTQSILSCLLSLSPVSYTHLDVYKRQTRNCSTFANILHISYRHYSYMTVFSYTMAGTFTAVVLIIWFIFTTTYKQKADCLQSKVSMKLLFS